MENKLSIQTKKKEALFERLQEIYDLSKKTKKDRNVARQFLVKARNIDTIRKEFIETIDTINEISFEVKEKFVPSYKELDVFEDMFCIIKDELIQTEAKFANESKSPQSTGHCRLQPINLPTFSGKQEEWPSFYQIFEKLVHDNSDYTDVEKVTHLITHLTNSAKLICSSIPPTAENYALILEALKNRYDDKRSLVSNYMEQILNFKAFNVESERSLENFLSCFVEPVNALKQMDIQDLADYLFVHIALKKLDSNTARSFENSCRSSKEIPQFKHLVSFVTEQLKILGRCNFPDKFNFSKKTHTGNKDVDYNKRLPSGSNYALLARESSGPSSNTHVSEQEKRFHKCKLCASPNFHHLYTCSKFKQMQVGDRWDFVKQNKLCFNCLSNLHMIGTCKSKTDCQIQGCGKKHHSLLHRKTEFNVRTPELAPVTTNSLPSTSAPEPTHTFCSTNNSSTVLLATVTVLAMDSLGEVHKIRGILEGGSQSNFITINACRKLNLSLTAISSVVKGIGSSPLNITACTSLNFFSHVDPSHKYLAHALVVDHLSDRIPTAPISLSKLHYLESLPLSDVEFHVPHNIDFLIGAELWPSIVRNEKVNGGEGTPFALNTTLGYVVMGRASIDRHVNSNSICFFSQQPLDQLVQKFWSIEDVPDRSPVSKDDLQCERFFMDTYVRNLDGTFTVRLPFRLSPDLLGNSRDSSIAKFISLERQFNRNPSLRTLYTNLIEEYTRDGTVSNLGRVSDIKEGGDYYIPHHGVYRPDHPTTPLRIVFNASAPTSSSFSLNQILYVGPKLHADIFEILIHFRLFRFCATADIRRMFLQIGIDQRDRRYHRFIWRSDPGQPLRVFEVNKVVFGNTCSPYLANRVVRLLAEHEKYNFPTAAVVAQRDIYVDDVVTSMDTETELIELHREMMQMFEAGGFQLTKWFSNSSLLNSLIHEKSCNTNLIDFDKEMSSKVLGLQWSPCKDYFECIVQTPDIPCTKRNILSMTARIFDPLGLVAPVTLLAKLIIKSLWVDGIDWDEVPPAATLEKWNVFKKSLPALAHIHFPRHVGIVSNAHVSLIGFADSSSQAYGACIYIRTCVLGEQPLVRLLCAKSRVAPAKFITIPRLELCAALLLAKLMRNVLNSYSTRMTFDEVVAFSDSKVVLNWIRSDPSKWKIFVANRISQIHDYLDNNCWRHVSGKDNPADVLSRGILASDLINHPLWFNGPPWLREKNIPASKYVRVDSHQLLDNDELKITSLLSTTSVDNVLLPLLNRISTFRKLLRSTAYVFRWCTRSHMKTPYVKISELNHANNFWIRYVQSVTYSDEIIRLRNGKPVRGSICHLNPFLHEGILRVGGRLQNAPLSFNQKHPILLPSRGKFLELIIDQYHVDLLHAGQQQILSIFRQTYWAPAVVSRIRSRVHKCNTCYRTRPKPSIPKMAPLPGIRVEGGLVFDRVGVDYAGPFYVTPFRRRGPPIRTKAYFCLFICLSVKAVHIELASDLTTDCFLAAFKRFISRRGPCSLILSDGGTNFTGARGQLGELGLLINSSSFQFSVGNALASKGIEWKINPANGPWFGGIWESNIKSIKGHLYRIVGNQILTYEEFNTLLIQIEAVMNSRPLCVLDNDPSAPTALTPAHFLSVGQTISAFPSPDYSDLPLNRLQRFQLIDRMVQDYWLRWQKEYLHTLQARTKWTKDAPSCQEGTVVVVMRDNIAPLQWPLGVIEKIYPGKDNIVRVVDVRTSSGTYRRPVGRVCCLPTQ